MEHCEECGFVYDDIETGAVPGALRALGLRYSMRLDDGRPDPILSSALVLRPQPDAWSALELACHVRDVFLIQRERVLLALVEEGPVFASMHRDERPRLARYLDQTPAKVTTELSVATEMLAFVFEGLDRSQWARRCTYNLPTPTECDLGFVGRHSVHEGEHHLRDVDAALRSASSARSSP